MFEKHREPLLPLHRFYWRLARRFAAVAGLIGGSLLVGIAGYHYFEGLEWVDALLESSMILSGMGPVATLHSMEGKIFASAYALYSGLLLIGSMGILLTPVVHRILHGFHGQHSSH